MKPVSRVQAALRRSCVAERGPTEPAAAQDVLLRALGVAAEEIPADPEERAALWRAQLAARRVVLVLDDAAGAGQLRPLLPASPGSLVLITSRSRLTGLDGVATVSIGGLPAEEAVTLLGETVEPGRVAAEPERRRRWRSCAASSR